MGDIWQSFIDGFIDYGMSAFDPLGIWKYPLVLIAVIGFIYAYTQSAIVTVVGIVITFALYGATTNIFVDVPDMTLFLYIVTLMGLTLLFTVLLIKRRS